MSIRIASPLDQQAWDAYVKSHRDANFYQLYGWSEVFRETYGCETCCLMIEVESGIKGVLPLFVIRDYLVVGNYVSSLPGGVCADDGDTAQALIEAAIELTKRQDAQYLQLRDELRRWGDENLETRLEYRYVVSDPLDDPDVAWKAIRSSARRAVRKARKKDLEVSWDIKYLEGFYHAYATNMRDLGTPAIPKRFFEASIERFPENARVLTVHLDDQVIGGLYLFEFNGVLSNPFASSMREFFDLRPNDLLYWKAIEYACEHGYRAVDLGRSVKDSGHARFKEKFCAKPQEMFYQYYLNAAEAIPTVRGGETYQIVSSIWKHLPLPVANTLSPFIRRVIPLG